MSNKPANPLPMIECWDGREFYLGQEVRPRKRTDMPDARVGRLARLISAQLVEVIWEGDDCPHIEDVEFIQAVDYGPHRPIFRHRDFDIYPYDSPDGSRFIWQHVDYDGPEDRRHGTSLCVAEAIEEIDAFIQEEEEHAKRPPMSTASPAPKNRKRNRRNPWDDRRPAYAGERACPACGCKAEDNSEWCHLHAALQPVGDAR